MIRERRSRRGGGRPVPTSKNNAAVASTSRLKRARPDPVRLAQIVGLLAGSILAVLEVFPLERPEFADDGLAMGTFVTSRQIQLAQISDRIDYESLPAIALIEGRTVMNTTWVRTLRDYTRDLESFLRVADAPQDGLVARYLEAQARMLDYTDATPECVQAVGEGASRVGPAQQGVLRAREIADRLKQYSLRAKSIDHVDEGDADRYVEALTLSTELYRDRHIVPLLGGYDGNTEPSSQLATLVDQQHELFDRALQVMEVCRDSSNQAAAKYNRKVRAFRFVLVLLVVLAAGVGLRRRSE